MIKTVGQTDRHECIAYSFAAKNCYSICMVMTVMTISDLSILFIIGELSIIILSNSWGHQNKLFHVET